MCSALRQIKDDPAGVPQSAGQAGFGECTAQGPRVLRRITDWRRAAGPAWSADGRTLYVANRDCTISVYRGQ